MGQSEEAAALLRQSLTITRTLLDRSLTVQSDRQRLRFLAQERGTVDHYLSVAPDARLPTGPLYEAVLAWKGALAARQAEEGAARGRPDLLPALDRLRQARAGLAWLYQQQPTNATQKADWLERFHAFEARKEQLEVELAGASETYRRFRDLREATAEQVAAALPPDAALVDFVQYSHYTPPAKSKRPPQREQRLLAFVLTRGRPPTCIPLGPADPLGQAAHAWRRDLLKPGAAADQSGAAVAERVWGPLRAHLGEAAARSATYSEDVESPGLFFNGFPWAAPTARASIAGRNPCRVSIARGAGQVIASLRQGLATAAGRPSALCAGFRASVMALRAADAMGRRRLRIISWSRLRLFRQRSCENATEPLPRSPHGHRPRQ